jgi:hypothetical protein
MKDKPRLLSPVLEGHSVVQSLRKPMLRRDSLPPLNDHYFTIGKNPRLERRIISDLG